MSETYIIPLNNGFETIVDAEDYNQLILFSWYASHSEDGRTYAKANVRPTKHSKRKAISMHRFIMKFPDGLVVDHINGNPLDNRKSNLRAVTQIQNVQGHQKARGQSKYRGVHLHTPGVWRAKVTVNYKTIYLGLFKSEDEAGEAARLGREKYYQ